MLILSKLWFIFKKQKHRKDKEVLIQDKIYSTRWHHPSKETRELCFPMVNTMFESSEDINNKLQSLKDKTEKKFCQKISNYLD